MGGSAVPVSIAFGSVASCLYQFMLTCIIPMTHNYDAGQDDLVESMVAHHEAELHSLHIAAVERAESMANTAREADAERRELQGMLDTFQPKLKAEEEKYAAMCEQLASYLGPQGKLNADVSLEDIVQSIKDKNAADLQPFNLRVKSLRQQLEECLTSHALKKRTIEENGMVLEHLQAQIDDMLDMQLMRKIRKEEKVMNHPNSRMSHKIKGYVRPLCQFIETIGVAMNDEIQEEEEEAARCISLLPVSFFSSLTLITF